MKKFIHTLIFILSFSFGFSQYVAIFEAETNNQNDSMNFMDMMMSSYKDVLGKDLNMVTFQKEGSGTHYFVRSYASLQEWVDEDNMSEEVDAKVFAKISQVENIQEKYQAFAEATDVKGARLYKVMDDYSTISGYYDLSIEEKMEYKYRRVVLYDLNDSGEQAFLADQKLNMEIDAKLGNDYYYALLRPVFATDADFMLVLIDKSRFDYHKNWSDRMEKRFADDSFNTNYEKNQKTPVSSVVDEWNLTLLEQYTY